LSQIALDLQPDIVHAMRIPFEGMMAAKALLKAPLVVSVWGNDFTLHSSATRKMMSLTKTTLQGCAALHVDCNRDLRLAKTLGFPSDRPAVVLPGSGGIIPDIFFPPPEETQTETLTIQGKALDFPTDATVIVNPRGFRAYVRNDTFFQSIPLILEQRSNTVFLCPAMGGLAEADKWVSDLGIGESVHLLPKLNAQEMAAVYRRSKISLSVSEHDGTPNTLLEAMACGCFPIAGDIDSIREWIGDGKNGFLVDPSKPNELADAVTKALEQPELVSQAREDNFEIIHERANRSKVMRRAERFYQELV
jgi:glycosyltransferase involved in cell wall biosynthesis